MAGRVPTGGRLRTAPGPGHTALRAQRDIRRPVDRHRHPGRGRPVRGPEAAVGFRPDIVFHGGPTPPSMPVSPTSIPFAVNAVGTRNIAEAAVGVGAHLVYVSTDYVFDGTLADPMTNGTHRIRVGLRAEQARRRDRGPRHGRAVGHRGPDRLGEWCPRGEHGQDGAPPGGARTLTDPPVRR